VPTVASPLDIVQAALKSGNVEMYREAVALFKELDGLAARKAFDKAMADAKGEIPIIRKSKTVGFDHKTGGDPELPLLHPGYIIRVQFVYFPICSSNYISPGKYSVRAILIRRTNGILSAIDTAPGSTIKNDMTSRLGSTRCGALWWVRGRVNRTGGSTLLCALAVTTSLVVPPAFAQSVGGGGGGTGGGNGGVGGGGGGSFNFGIVESGTGGGGGGGAGTGGTGGGIGPPPDPAATPATAASAARAAPVPATASAAAAVPAPAAASPAPTAPTAIAATAPASAAAEAPALCLPPAEHSSIPEP
jgi:hypothetical protein